MKPYGMCPQCLRWIRITNAEKLFKHGYSDRSKHPLQSCLGWGQTPTRIEWELSAEEAQVLNTSGPYVRRGRPQRKP